MFQLHNLFIYFFFFLHIFFLKNQLLYWTPNSKKYLNLELGVNINIFQLIYWKKNMLIILVFDKYP